MPRIIKPAIALGVAVALTASIAVATGAIPSADGTVHTCVVRASGGIVRVIDQDKGEKCVSGLETPLDLNQKGQKGDPGAPGKDGAPGAPGAPGQKGDKGDAGPAGGLGQVFQRVFAGGLLPKLNNTTKQVISTKDVPAGKYAVFAKGSAFSIEGRWTLDCDLLEDGVVLDNASVEAENDGETPYVLMGTATKAGDSHTIEVKCSSGLDDSPNTFIHAHRLLAVPIQSVG